MARRWLVIETRGGCEWTAFMGLRRPRIDGKLRTRAVFFPFWLGSWRRGAYPQGLTRPHFPGYIFAALDELQSAEHLREVIGVKGAVKSGAEYVVIPEPDIRDLKRKALKYWDRPFDCELGFQRFQAHALEEGDWTSIPEGPFENVPALVEHVDKHGRVTLSVGRLRISFPAVSFAQKVRDKSA